MVEIKTIRNLNVIIVWGRRFLRKLTSMKKFLLIFSVVSLSYIHAQTDQLEGQYILYKKHSSVATNVMFIDKIDETTFEIRGIDWKGIGKISNNKGYYEFEFNNGDVGRTEFRINKNGELEGSVKFDENNLIWVNMDWAYVAKKKS
jgi:hypothetical protein